MRSEFVHSYYSKKVLAEKPLWVCRNFMVQSVSSHLMARSTDTESECISILGCMAGLPISPLLEDSAIPLMWEARFSGSCSPCLPMQSQLPVIPE